MTPLLGWLTAAAASAAATYFSLSRAIEWLRLRALAHPNRRSSHAYPTPQGAGIVVVPIALVMVAALGLLGVVSLGSELHVSAVLIAASILIVVGFADDVRGLSVRFRLGAQVVAAALVILSIPPDMRLLPAMVPLVAERALAFLALLWFVNLTNFMDGIDWLSAIETIAITFGIVLLAALDLVPPALGWWAAAFLGVMAGFMPWNAPPARVFLGDAGSLPLGLLMGSILLHVSASGAHAAALILPLYYLADATITLLRRVARGEKVWQAHREHYYQQARQGGWSVRRIIAHVAILNGGLVALAVLAAWTATAAAGVVSVSVAALCVAMVLYRLAAAR